MLALVQFAASCASDNGPWIVNADIGSNGSNQVYVAGYDRSDAGFVKHLEGGRWATVHEAQGPLGGIWVSETGDVVAVGSMGDIAVFSDGSWRSTPLGTDANLTALWGSSLTDVFAVGQAGLVVHYDGVEWHEMSAPTSSNLRAVWGTASDNIFVVGNAGVILHYDGSMWNSMPSGTSEDLNGVWGSDAQNVYAVGGSESSRRHIILRFDGSDWYPARTGEPYHLLGIHGTSADNIYAVGASRHGDDVRSAMVHFDGNAWQESAPPVRQFLWDVLAIKEGGCYVVGPDDTLARLR